MTLLKSILVKIVLATAVLTALTGCSDKVERQTISTAIQRESSSENASEIEMTKVAAETVTPTVSKEKPMNTPTEKSVAVSTDTEKTSLKEPTKETAVSSETEPTAVPTEAPVETTPETTVTPIPTEPPKSKTFVHYTNKTFANLGRLQIPALDIDVAVTDDCTQANCDKQDLAIYYEYGYWKGEEQYYEYIGDHCHQEFKLLPNIQVGDRAYLYDKNGIYREFVCETVLFNVLDTEYEGMRLNGKVVQETYPHRLYISTCCPKYPSIMIAVMREYKDGQPLPDDYYEFYDD